MTSISRENLYAEIEEFKELLSEKLYNKLLAKINSVPVDVIPDGAWIIVRYLKPQVAHKDSLYLVKIKVQCSHCKGTMNHYDPRFTNCPFCGSRNSKRAEVYKLITEGEVSDDIIQDIC